MFKSAFKLAGLFLLLVLSFVYTNSVFNGAKKSDPVMKEIINYKKENDVLGVEPIIKNDEMVIGYSGLVVNENESYKNMKKEDVFDESKIVYDKSLPKTTISKTYDYYINRGNPSKKEVALVFKVSSSKGVDDLLKQVAKNNVNVAFFVDGAWLEQNVETAFSMVNLLCEIYNLGYDGSYQKKSISSTNNLIESISLKNSNFCITNDKNDNVKELCKSKKMHTIIPTLSDPSVLEIKKGLVKGAIISYDVRDFNVNMLSLIINTITSKGYNVTSLQDVINEG